jgi:hypothetical protein
VHIKCAMSAKNGDIEGIMRVVFSESGTLALPGEVGAEEILLPGPLFKLGDYPDKDFSLSEDEADAAVAAFQGAPMNSEHGQGDGFLGKLVEGQLGQVKKIWLEGQQVMAQYSVPKWLAGLSKDKAVPLKTSAEWDKNTKRLVGAAWTLKPYLKDNELIAAFSASGDVPDFEGSGFTHHGPETSKSKGFGADHVYYKAGKNGVVNVRNQGNTWGVHSMNLANGKESYTEHPNAADAHAAACAAYDGFHSNAAKFSQDGIATFSASEEQGKGTAEFAEEEPHEQAMSALIKHHGGDKYLHFRSAGRARMGVPGSGYDSISLNHNPKTGNIIETHMTDTSSWAGGSSTLKGHRIQPVNDVLAGKINTSAPSLGSPEVHAAKEKHAQALASQYGGKASKESNGDWAVSGGKGMPSDYISVGHTPEGQIHEKHMNHPGGWSMGGGPKQVGEKFHEPASVGSAPAKFSETPEAVELAALRAEKLKREAEDWVESVIAAKKAIPAERGWMLALFTQARADDTASGDNVVRFSEASQPVSRVQALKAGYEMRMPHSLEQELLDPNTSEPKLREVMARFSKTISNTTTTEGLDGKPSTSLPKNWDEKRVELLKSTPMGREILKEQGLA